MRKVVKTAVALLVVFALAVMAACGKGDIQEEAESPAPPTEKPVVLEPVTLTFFSGTAGTMNEQQFKAFVEEPGRKKYPHITFKFVLNASGTRIQDLITSGQIPDLIVNGPSSISTYRDLALTEDVTPLARKHQFDFRRMDDSVLDFVRAYSDNNGLYTMPFMNGSTVLFYNKDIFDRFGVPYPKDFMTWEQIYDLARRITRTDGGVQYRGIDLFALRSYNQLSATYLDPATDRPILGGDKWERLLQTWDQFFKIPGNEFVSSNFGDMEKAFITNRTMAMLIAPFNNPFNGISANEDAKATLNWDMVTMPVYSDKPTTGTSAIPNHVMITKTSKYKDDAFRVVETMLSDEVQTMLSRGGIVPVLKKQSVRDEFVQDIDFAKNKNVQAVFKLDRAAARTPSRYDGALGDILNAMTKDIHSGVKDINTAIRDAEEAATKAVAAEKAK